MAKQSTEEARTDRPQPLDAYRLGIRVRFDIGWPVPARSQWLNGIVTEINDRLLIDNFAVARTERELVVREVLDDGSIMTAGSRFRDQDSAALVLAADASDTRIPSKR